MKSRWMRGCRISPSTVMTSAFDRQLAQPRRARRWLLLLGLLVTVLVHLPSMVSVERNTVGRFYDSDGYMRLQRVIELNTHGRWYDAQTPRTNAPEGETLHWTRPLDTILLAGAWLGSGVTDFRDALEAWGTIISPVMLLILTVVWYRGTSGLLSNRGFVLSLVILPLLPMFDLGFAIGRPDHHSLLNLLFMAALVLIFRIATEGASARLALAAGVLSGVSMWISVEAMTTTAFLGASLALLWLWRGPPYLSRTVLYMVGLFSAISLALLVERPPDQWTTPIFDSISVVHWVLAAAAAIVWVLIAAGVNRFGGDDNVLLRFAGVLVGALVPALVVILLFPQFLQGPFAEYDGVFFDQWLHSITEYQSLRPISRARVGLLVDQLGPVLIAVIYTLYRLRRGGPAERRLMAVLLFGFACFVPLSLAVVRWSVYAQALAWLPWALAVQALFDRDPKATIAGLRLRIRAPAAAIFLTAPALLSLAVMPKMPGQQAAPSSVRPSTQSVARSPVGPGCDWPGMVAYLSQRHAATNGSEQLLLTDLFPGPALVWSTPYNVIGAPYGNAHSLNDTYKFFDAIDDSAAKEVAARRGIDLVLVCRSSPERQYYGGTGMYAQLSNGTTPEWLDPVQLPSRLSASFRLFRVSR